MLKQFSLFLLLALVGVQNSCNSVQQSQRNREQVEEEEKVRIPPPLHLGAVHQVIPERNFALLRIIGPMPKEGTVLISHPADGAVDRVGNLIVSGGQHRRGNIIVADIRSGTVIKGDRVFLYRSIAAGNEEEELPEEETDTQIDTGGEETLPDFNSTSAVSDAGSSPFNIPSAPVVREPGTEQTSIPEEPPTQSEAPSDIPEKLLDVPDTLDGWN